MVRAQSPGCSQVLGAVLLEAVWPQHFYWETGASQSIKSSHSTFSLGVEASNVQNQDWDQPGQWIQHNQGLRRNFL